MIIKGTFTSEWDDGVEITTKATLDTETGAVDAETADVENLDFLQREFFTSSEFANAGEEYEICPECHEYIITTSMEPGIGHNLDEVKKCKNPNCDYIWNY